MRGYYRSNFPGKKLKIKLKFIFHPIASRQAYLFKIKFRVYFKLPQPAFPVNFHLNAIKATEIKKPRTFVRGLTN
ncbi:MAG: hypothetical protein CSB55_02785 [Candidatus Cloacimonadota bacterium]|nr:MAG: hypothetical protein CSB55_02785 [Candidatus Cloacimonadota bacterium]